MDNAIESLKRDSDKSRSGRLHVERTKKQNAAHWDLTLKYLVYEPTEIHVL